MFQTLFIAFLALLLIVDLVFLPKPSRRVWQVLLVGFVLAALVTAYPNPFIRLSEFLGLGRPVDGVIYVSTVVLVRELFLTRARVARLEHTITQLTRGIAIGGRQEVSSRPSTDVP